MELRNIEILLRTIERLANVKMFKNKGESELCVFKDVALVVWKMKE